MLLLKIQILPIVKSKQHIDQNVPCIKKIMKVSAMPERLHSLPKEVWQTADFFIS